MTSTEFIPVDEDGMCIRLQPYEVAEEHTHEWDAGAGHTPPNRSGSVEILDVCLDCGETRRTGVFDSIL